MKNYSYFVVINFTKEISCPIFGAIIDDDDFSVFNGLLFYGCDERVDRISFVVTRNNDA